MKTLSTNTNTNLNVNDALIKATKETNSQVILNIIQDIKSECNNNGITSPKDAKNFISNLKKEMLNGDKANSKFNTAFSMASKIILHSLSVKFNLLSKIQLEKVLKTNDFEAINSIYNKAKKEVKKVNASDKSEAEKVSDKLQIDFNYIEDITTLIESYTIIKSANVKVIKGKK